jgi:hypothetical protein
VQDQQIKLELSVTEVNGVLQALGQMPYASVVNLVLKIQQQAQAQVEPPPQPEATPES